jgi:hypothetical protein
LSPLQQGVSFSHISGNAGSIYLSRQLIPYPTTQSPEKMKAVQLGNTPQEFSPSLSQRRCDILGTKTEIVMKHR